PMLELLNYFGLINKDLSPESDPEANADAWNAVIDAKRHIEKFHQKRTMQRADRRNVRAAIMQHEVDEVSDVFSQKELLRNGALISYVARWICDLTEVREYRRTRIGKRRFQAAEAATIIKNLYGLAYPMMHPQLKKALKAGKADISVVLPPGAHHHLARTVD